MLLLYFAPCRGSKSGHPIRIMTEPPRLIISNNIVRKDRFNAQTRAAPGALLQGGHLHRQTQNNYNACRIIYRFLEHETGVY
jgi:hypothetical protein